MNIYLGDIRSKTSLLETARVLRVMADGFENQAKILEQKRNYYGIGKHDITPLARAIKFIKSSPEFPFYSASDCRKICDRFALDYLPAAEVLMKTQTKRRLEILTGFGFASIYELEASFAASTAAILLFSPIKTGVF